MQKKLPLLFLLFFSFSVFSQEKIAKGKVIINAALHNVKVENINREISVRTDENGGFSIIASEGEVLVFSGLNINRKVFFLKKEHFENPFEIDLKTTDIEIEEVEVGKQIDLGFGGKKLTPAERRLQTATDTNLQYSVIIPTLRFSIDPLLNRMSGKTKRLKKLLEMEQQERMFLELDYYFDEDFYVHSLGLKPENINDFKYFLIEDFKFQNVLKHGNENNIIIETIKMYESYQKIKTDED